MPLKILLADDSMTAQKMGKEILTAAGYEVIAVSNGAVAAKKLADKPDIIILDVFMPGYTGLELCEKVRASADLAKTPVLLTVGKMEPYRAEDGQKVKADGVIIKPFEATDLLAAVQKLVEKISRDAKPNQSSGTYEKTMMFKAPQIIKEFKDDSYAEWKSEAEQTAAAAEAGTGSPVQMSAEMGAAPAFGADFMGGQAAAPAETSNAAVPAAAAELTSVESQSLDSLLERTSEPTSSSAPVGTEVEFTAAPQTGEIEVRPEPGLQRGTEHPGADDVPVQDPALVTDPHELASKFVTTFGDKGPEDAQVREKVYGGSAEAESMAPVDAEFEARVNAAMSGYDTGLTAPTEAEPIPTAAEAPTAAASTYAAAPTYEDTQKISAPTGAVEAEIMPSQQPPAGMHNAELVEQMQAAFANLPVETAPIEEHVDIAPSAVTAPATEAAAPTSASSGPDLELANALAAAVGADAALASGETSGAATNASIDHEATSRVVTRVLERMLPSIMHELAKEMEAAKKK